eukprot:jgi/Mesvir1/20122/Mv13361-RA.1
MVRREPTADIVKGIREASTRVTSDQSLMDHLALLLEGRASDGVVKVKDLFNGVLSVCAQDTFLLSLGCMEGREERAKVIFVYNSPCDPIPVGASDLLQMSCIAAPHGVQVVDVFADYFGSDTVLLPTAYMHAIRLIKDWMNCSK